MNHSRLKFPLIILLFICWKDYAQPVDLPIYRESREVPADWLLDASSFKAGVFRSANGNDIILDNGLLRRSFRITPEVACYDFYNRTSGQQLIRSVKPEARVILDGQPYPIGGLTGQREQAYLRPEWLDGFRPDSGAFRFEKFTIEPIVPVVNWKQTAWAAMATPAGGQSLLLHFFGPDPATRGVRVIVRYDLYDGLPLVVKSVLIVNGSGKAVRIDRVVNEVLGLVEEESAVVGTPEQMKKQHGLYVETNYAFNNAMRYDISDQTTHWNTDPVYTSQVNYNYMTPCLLEVYPEKAPGVTLKPGEEFRSVRTHELLMDSYDRERRGLAIRRMYKTVAPWTRQNPIFMHLVSKTDQEVRTAIDQCAETGYEAVILSFGSHLNMEDDTPANYARWKELANYAHGKNILLGGYSLFSSRRISDADDVVDPKTGKPGGAFFGNAPCFGSKWGLAYRDKIKRFFSASGFDLWENDGPYPGDVCGSTTHPGHEGLADSQWRQMEIQKELYRWLNERGVYINAPDWYFLDGTHKIAIGYREVNFSLPRDQQRVLNRQNIYDGTFEKNGSMSWGFVPLTRYQGGGPEAVLEPLNEHLADYEQLMMQYYGAGVQACYRGPRLFDTPQTRDLVRKTIGWYKEHREILNSDIIHLRRADGRDWDGWMHVNPALAERALLMVFNPEKQAITRTIRVPLYYSGVRTAAEVLGPDGSRTRYTVDSGGMMSFSVTIPAEGYYWAVVRQGGI
ncbi:MAG: alpha-galactosidase [Bacteroidota bacterium]